MGLNEFVSIRNLTKEDSVFIRQLENDKEELRRCQEIVMATLWDRGGQEAFRSAHPALMAECTVCSPTADMLVFDITKHIESVIQSSFREDMVELESYPKEQDLELTLMVCDICYRVLRWAILSILPLSTF